MRRPRRNNMRRFRNGPISATTRARALSFQGSYFQLIEKKNFFLNQLKNIFADIIIKINI